MKEYNLFTNFKTMPHTYEVEVKTLLGTKEKADALVSALKKNDPKLRVTGEEKQLNHYFNSPKDFSALVKKIQDFVSKEQIETLDKTLKQAKKASVRTRDTNGKVILVVKASVGDDTSSNGVKRIEWEAHMPKLTIDKLDEILLNAGFTYQAKWSRERQTFQSNDMSISIDKNAGYGYLAEFERVTTEEGKLDEIKSNLISFMESVGVLELQQDRLERMFSHYNAHWPEYYGTDKTFIIE